MFVDNRAEMLAYSHAVSAVEQPANFLREIRLRESDDRLRDDSVHRPAS